MCANIVQSAVAVEYTDCFSADEWDHSKEYRWYDIK